MMSNYLANYIARETNRNLNIQGPTLRTYPGLPTILTTPSSANSWICPCGLTFPFAPNATTIPPPQQPWQPAPTQIECYVEFTLRPAFKPQRHDYNIILTRNNAGRWLSDDVQMLMTPWIMDDFFFQHLSQNPLHASAFTRELSRNSTFIKLIHHSGPKDPAVRLLVRYSGTTLASNTLVEGQRWRFEHTKALWHPIAALWFIWMMSLYLVITVLVVGTSKGVIRISSAELDAIRAVVMVALVPFFVLTYLLMRVTNYGRRIR